MPVQCSANSSTAFYIYKVATRVGRMLAALISKQTYKQNPNVIFRCDGCYY